MTTRPTTSVHALELSDLTLSIGKRRLLDSMTLDIQQGERIAIVGANGSGKTTLLRCLLGLVKGDSGVIRVNGTSLEKYTRQELARNISYVPQQLSSEIPFTVAEFILMSRYAHGAGWIPRDAVAINALSHALDRTGIRHLEHQLISTLSGGERQKVNIAAALARQAPILILDEPTSDLDPKQREVTQALLGEIGRKSHTTILAVTHDLNWAAMDFDRILGMSHGRILIDAPPSEFITTENLRRLFDAEWTIQAHPGSGNPIILPTHHAPIC